MSLAFLFHIDARYDAVKPTFGKGKRCTLLAPIHPHFPVRLP